MAERRPQVPADVDEVIKARSAEFREAIASRDFDAAAVAADARWAAIPDPKSQWDYYPTVLPRSTADMFVRAGDATHASEWLAVAMDSSSATIGENVPLDRVAARVRLAMGDRDTAERIAGTLLELHGTRPFSGDDQDLLPLAQAYAAGRSDAEASTDEESVADLPLANDGAATERPDLDDEIERLSEAGSQAMDDGDWRAAVARWTEALTIIPAPRNESTASTWLYTVIGDAYYNAGQVDAASLSLGEALKCPDAVESPFLWLRLGQVLTDSGHAKQGTDALLSAYMLAGAEIFEDQDPRYLEQLSERVDLDKP